MYTLVIYKFIFTSHENIYRFKSEFMLFNKASKVCYNFSEKISLQTYNKSIDLLKLKKLLNVMPTILGKSR